MMSASTSDLGASDSVLGLARSDTNSSNTMMDASAPEYLGRSSSPPKTQTRAGVSPSFYSDTPPLDDVFDYASKYVRPPAPPEAEEDALLFQSSANADPDDPLAKFDNFQDEFEDEMDEIEMHAMNGSKRRGSRVNLSDMEASAKRRKRLRKCSGFACLFVLVAAVAGAVGGLLAMKGDSGSKTPQAVPEASKLLKLWCNEELDLGPGQAATFPLEAPDECKVACSKADCCWNPNSKHECTVETAQFCHGYKGPCDIMIHQITSDKVTPPKHAPASEVVVPVAPGSLKAICVPQGPSFTATEMCYNICEKADCCWNTTSTAHCTADSFQKNCEPYDEYCSFFNEHPPGPSLPGGASGSDGANNPNDDDDEPFPPASPSLNAVCTEDNMAANGPENCQQQCSLAECCWKVGVVSCPASVSSQLCSGYDGCNALNDIITGGGTIDRPPTNTDHANAGPFPEAPGGLEVYCSPTEMEEISLHICQDKCEPAACCWNTHVDSCDASVPAELCEPYVKSCALLNDLASYPESNGANTNPAATAAPADVNSVPQPPSDFTVRCDKENIVGSANGGDQLIECERDCLKASCCWKPGVDSCVDNQHCDVYNLHCSVFVGLFGGSTTGGTTGSTGSNTGGTSSGNTGNTGSNTGSGTTTNIPDAPSELNTVCAPDVLNINVNGGESIVACEKQCLPASCCWKPTSARSCVGAAQCDPYMEPCGTNLVNALVELEGGTSIAQASGTQDSQAAQDIASACDNQQAIFIKSKCDNACRPGNCCFDDGVACSSGVDCSIYDPCGVLHRRNLRH